MSGILHTFRNATEDIAGWFGLKHTLDKGYNKFGLSSVMNGNGTTLPPPPTAPTMDTAANAAQQQADMLRRRRGVMANIFGGAPGQNPAAPQVTNKSQLGI